MSQDERARIREAVKFYHDRILEAANGIPITQLSHTDFVAAKQLAIEQTLESFADLAPSYAAYSDHMAKLRGTKRGEAMPERPAEAHLGNALVVALGRVVSGLKQQETMQGIVPRERGRGGRRIKASDDLKPAVVVTPGAAVFSKDEAPVHMEGLISRLASCANLGYLPSLEHLGILLNKPKDTIAAVLFRHLRDMGYLIKRSSVDLPYAWFTVEFNEARRRAVEAERIQRAADEQIAQIREETRRKVAELMGVPTKKE